MIGWERGHIIIMRETDTEKCRNRVILYVVREMAFFSLYTVWKMCKPHTFLFTPLLYIAGYYVTRGMVFSVYEA